MIRDADWGDDTPTTLSAPAPDVALWWASLAAPPQRQAQFEAWLSPAERMRMARFGTAELRARYLAGRGTLRWILGRVLDVAPGAVVLTRGIRGRPRLAEGTDIDFNVTHTAGHAMIGVTRGRRIGVDIERVDRPLNAAGVSRKFMSQSERDALPVDPDAHRRQLLQLWTCKEAMSKATGDALSAPFARIEVALAPSLGLAAGPPPYVPDAWSLHAISASPDHYATVALWRGAPASD